MEQTSREYEHLSQNELIRKLWRIWIEDLNDICAEACLNDEDLESIGSLYSFCGMLEELMERETPPPPTFQPTETHRYNRSDSDGTPLTFYGTGIGARTDNGDSMMSKKKCQICDDTGWDNMFGDAVPCEFCEAGKQFLAVQSSGQIGTVTDDSRFECFDCGCPDFDRYWISDTMLDVVCCRCGATYKESVQSD